MARGKASPPQGNTFTRFFDRVDRVLLPALGPPRAMQEERGDEIPRDQRACPICGHPMYEHVIDHSTANTVLECPTEERLPEREVPGPYNELGMPATGRRLEKLAGRRAAGE